VREGFTLPEGIMTLGVNDVGRYGIQPEHLFVIDTPARFIKDTRDGEERVAAIRAATPNYFWYESTDWLKVRRSSESCIHRHVKTITLERWDGNPDTGPVPGRWTIMTPALVLAYQLGARDIAIIGSEFLGHSELYDKKAEVNSTLKRIGRVLTDAGCTIKNVSPVDGCLTAFPRESLQSWLARDMDVAGP
jgi:hypothetical protein